MTETERRQICRNLYRGRLSYLFRPHDLLKLETAINPRKRGRPFAGWQALLMARPEERTVALALANGLSRSNLAFDEFRHNLHHAKD